MICTYIHSQQKGALNCAASTASFIFVSVANARDESSELLPRNALSAHPRTLEARYFYKFWVLVETVEMSLRSALVSSSIRTKLLKKRKKKLDRFNVHNTARTTAYHNVRFIQYVCCHIHWIRPFICMFCNLDIHQSIRSIPSLSSCHVYWLLIIILHL